MKDGYLTLTRKLGEELIFSVVNTDGSSIDFKLVVSKQTGNQTRFSIQAPENMKILRGGSLVG